MIMGSDDFDVIVVGCGIAGLSAAITAQQNGARVAILERAPRDERGGNTRYTESFWRMKSEDAVSGIHKSCFAFSTIMCIAVRSIPHVESLHLIVRLGFEL